LSATLDPGPLLRLQGDRSDIEFARIIGITRRTLIRWRQGRDRQLYSVTAERAAVALGRHPSELWPDVVLDGNWQKRAACRGADSNLFFPPMRAKGGPTPASLTRRAKEMCERCPVQAECLDWVLRNVGNSNDFGTWAGTNRNQRATMRKGMGLT
jgi:WhiB family redox-sensing transcriptional regulator